MLGVTEGLSQCSLVDANFWFLALLQKKMAEMQLVAEIWLSMQQSFANFIISETIDSAFFHRVG